MQKFLMEGRLHQNNDVNKFSDVQDMDSAVNKGTDSPEKFVWWPLSHEQSP